MTKEIRKKVIKLTGKEIRKTFGSKEVEDLEEKKRALLERLDSIYSALRSGEDIEHIDEMKLEANDLKAELKVLNKQLREEQNRFGEILKNA